MEYIYRKLDVPSLPRQLMAHFLGASQIDFRTAFGWLDASSGVFGADKSSLLYLSPRLTLPSPSMMGLDTPNASM
ncbi:hypothetical protein H257_17856 [Aphanomyces astaci]|uniref:Uncharacterized protein n=1 Tax=Aphanomyces astaci TaxID=112090 RepID=W4FD36_APHAT|nr:hypothetical protein H257_17856 [Aphanomyces astaci]ETV65395.1 hypothetical protein H257_17856 [Aphanomyces astaci]|eukprot:XP_009845110.1 hypothetical protein H257_17856 [Aphanomyces astaci]